MMHVRRSARALAMTGALASLLLCAAAAPAQDHAQDHAQAEAVEEPAPEQLEHTNTGNDPLRSINRPIFSFNERLDRYVVEPVAKGYDFVMPDRVQGWINNFFWNLSVPMVTANCLLQGKPDEAVTALSRFMINSTIGVAGFGDPATSFGMPQPWEDFGQTLGVWGVPTGPYLVLPLLGPSNFRDGAGIVADSAIRIWPYYVDWWVSLSATTIEILNLRSVYIEQVREARERSLDYYVFIRDAYLQRRQALVEDRLKFGDSSVYSGAPAEAVSDDLYNLPDEEN